jgi:hypothetical protein
LPSSHDEISEASRLKARFPEAGDEQDIKMLAHKMDEGIVLTNWDPE